MFQIVNDNKITAVGLQLISNCLASNDGPTVHYGLQAYDAIITEISDGPNVQKAKSMVQSTLKAIETLIRCGDESIDWAIEGFTMWNQLFGSSLNFIPGSSIPDLGIWAGNIFRQRDGLSEDNRIRKVAYLSSVSQTLIQSE